MKGSYCLVIELKEEVEIKVGALGLFLFPKGIYFYVGRAMGPGGIEARISRHRRKGWRRPRWHIDYLLERSEVVGEILFPGNGDECKIARDMLEMAGGMVVAPGFGSSDCRCPTHLIYFG
jgi:Uri superfamily endonuclease